MILVCDGSNLVYRYLFAFQDEDKAVGWAIKNLLELWKKYNGEGIIVVWEGGSDKRKEIFKDYKKNRVNMDKDLLRRYIKMCKEFKTCFQFCGLVQCSVAGEEGDDVVATFVSDIFKDDEVLICSNDKDFYSLLSDRVKIWDWKTIKTAFWFEEEYGISVDDWVKVRSLAGDGSDNIPGVKGIGIKTAIKIIQENRYEDYISRSDVKVFKKVLEFRDIDSDSILDGLDFGHTDKFKILQMLEFCRVNGVDIDDIINVGASARIRQWKLSGLSAEMSVCRECDLSKTATQVVTFKGDLSSDILIIGEAPGAEEDSAGEPFVGKAGRELDKWLRQIGIVDKSIISNVVWCRPVDELGRNRAPKPKEIDFCSKRGLLRLINRMMPKLIICLGNNAASFVLDNNVKITRDYGKYKVERFGRLLDVWMIPHPAALLHGGGKSAGIISDQLPKLKEFIKSQGYV